MSTMPVGGPIPRAADDVADLVVRDAETHTGDPHLPTAGTIAARPLVPALAVLPVGTTAAAARLSSAAPARTGPRS
ncbi:hypothetical protein SUDANB145_00063 [Streptomyces sp. enrichment culture]|uniref:hypothetical protein n=1 Tax=Streptomyces sp. enrichment culture TaxID=1795815 RepID=UPI003F5779F9